MIIIKRLFADKILRYSEVTERFLAVLGSAPGLGSALNGQIVEKRNDVLKNIIGVIAQLFVLAWDFIKKLLFVIVFVWVPYRLLANDCPLIAEQRTLTLLFLFFMICTVCGSIANNIVSIVDRRDYLVTRIILVSPAINFLGQLIYKMVTDFIYFTLALYLIKIPLKESVMLAAVTMFARPIGEVVAILMYEKSRLLYNNKGAVYGTLMALTLMGSYGSLYMMRSISEFWYVVVNPVLTLVLFVLGVVAFLVLCNYRNYSKIVSYGIAKK